MGMYILPYAVELEKVKSTFNSKNEKLYHQILNNRTFQSYASDITSLSMETALKQIIHGEEKDKEFASVYGYTLLGIVAYWGIELAMEGDIFKIGSIMDDQDKKLKEFGINIKLEEDLIDPIYNFDIPSSNDFPFIGGISKKHLSYLQKELNAIEILKTSISPYYYMKDSEELMAICALKRGVNLCVNRGLEWISFAH